MSWPKSLPRQRVVICGSMAFYSTMVELGHRLREANIPCVLPDIDEVLPGISVDSADADDLKRKASMRHIRRVRDQRTFAILAVNLDKHGLPDYIGANTFAEIAIAVAHYKPIYLYQGIPAFYEDELLAWRAMPLDGQLENLIRDFTDKNQDQKLQWDLFDEGDTDDPE